VTLVLAGDIGGTNARLALAEVNAGTRIVAEHDGKSQNIGDFAGFVADFLARSGARPEGACLAIAGPVIGNSVTGTNLPWTVEAGALGRRIGVSRVRLINDFAAIGYGIRVLEEADLLTLQPGHPDPSGVIGIIGAGTGLGEGMVVRSGGQWTVLSSEGGHATYAPVAVRERDLYAFLSDRYGGHVSVERVASGPGLVDTFEFLTAKSGGPSEAIREELRREDPAAVITRHALARTDAAAREALSLFIDAYGSQAGNLALTVLATGGIYVAGGIAAKIASELAEGRFLEAFRNKGRMRGLLERIPVHVILNPDVGLLGAASAAGL
jgi:glucokinase